jgi:hypothetical protein
MMVNWEFENWDLFGDWYLGFGASSGRRGYAKKGKV